MQRFVTKSKSWLWLYIPFWLFLLYQYFQILGFKAEDGGNLFLGALYTVEFGVHEAGHIIFGFLPAILVAAAGSLTEMAFTWLIAIAAWRQKAYFAFVYSLIWVMLSMNSAGRYMADAIPQNLPLVGLGPDPQHDWHFVFGKLGWLPASAFIGDTVRALGDIAGALGLIFGLILIVYTATNTSN
jgi:hypothetical protein